MILFEKYGQHQPLNRQSDRYALEGVDLSLSTLADQVGACTVVLRPLYDLVRAHVLAAERVHGDDTPVPVLAKGRTKTGRLWTYVRDDRPFAGPDPPAAVFFYSPDRTGEHPERHLDGFASILQADAYAGFNRLFEPDRKPGPVIEAACWAHARRKFFVLADIGLKARGKLPVIAPLAVAAVRRIDAIFDAERAINGAAAADRLAVRRATIAPLVTELETWMRAERGKLSRHAEVAKAMDYMLKRWPAFTRFLADGRVCLSNNAAERALRGIALGRKSWLFCGSDRGGERAAVIYSLIGTAKLNDVDPQAWLADVLARIRRKKNAGSATHANLRFNHVASALPKSIVAGRLAETQTLPVTSHRCDAHRGSASEPVVYQKRIGPSRRSSPMPTQCSQGEHELGRSGGRKLVGAFDGRAITSNVGVALLASATSPNHPQPGLRASGHARALKY